MNNCFSLHPNVYATGECKGLVSMLENVWIRGHRPGDGIFYIVSGFTNYNGGVRFYPTFKHHTENGGRIIAYLGGSTAQRLSSQQSVEALLQSGVEVNIVNRKRLLHAKCYGAVDSRGQQLVVTSGNFTGPGMSQNVEAALMLGEESTRSMGFSWPDLVNGISSQRWEFYKPSLSDRKAPAWNLLFDEVGAGEVVLDTTQEVTMIVTLGHHDTVRIQANPGDVEGTGSQYFWLSRDCYDFFPALTIRNERGTKQTFSAIIKMFYVDLNMLDDDCRVTFEAENNLDFRLGTGKLRYTKIAQEGDLAVISRVSEDEYELRIIKKDTAAYNVISPYATNFIGHRGKRFGFISNQEFERKLEINLKRRISHPRITNSPSPNNEED